jgi:hypothetical protein
VEGFTPSPGENSKKKKKKIHLGPTYSSISAEKNVIEHDGA